ncbi:hypothetical protein ACEU6E_08000 [Halorutilales archaeon Cl-col2-1]
MDDIGGRVEEILEVDADDYDARVREDAEFVKHELSRGTFNNPQAIIGLEHEFYAVDETAESPYLARVPRPLLSYIGFEKELGLHNAEMVTSPQPLNGYGIRAQENEVKSKLKIALETLKTDRLRLVSSGIWTIPPQGETAREYLLAGAEDDGVHIASNMSPSVRYQAMSNQMLRMEGDIELEAPHVSLGSKTVMPESLITSIQPHYQVPQASELPTYFSYALRIAPAILSLGVNSPFFPPDLYDDVPANLIIEDAWDESRINVFESVLNFRDKTEKVSFPRDIETVEEAVDAIADDEVYVPMPIDGGSRFDDEFGHLKMKRGTYWRWIRPVFEGSTRSDAHVRVEFRPLAGQPTIRDTIGFQALYAGLLTALTRLDHPLIDLAWEKARDSFYDAAENGLDAEIDWIGSDGSELNGDEIYDEMIELASRGLQSYGIDGDEAYRYLWPLKKRYEEGITPADWKKKEVKRRLSEGEEFETALRETERKYIELQKETLFEGSFADWLEK